MDWQTALQTILSAENPLAILLIVTIIVIALTVARSVSAVAPLIANLIAELSKIAGVLHELNIKIGDQLDALQRIDDGTKQRTEKGVAIILEHNERTFAALRQQLDDNHTAQISAIERIEARLSVNQRLTPRVTEHDKGTS